MTQALRFDATASKVVIETRAKGMLAKLAHDLSIDAKDVAVTVELEAGSARLELRAPIARLAVDGVLKGGSIDRGALSRSDKDEIERKIRAEVLHGQDVVVTMSGPLAAELVEGKHTVEASGRVEVGGRSTRVSSRCELGVGAERVTAAGRVKLSLASLGITAPKGPLGAFRVDDEVEVAYSLVFARV